MLTAKAYPNHSSCTKPTHEYTHERGNRSNINQHGFLSMPKLKDVVEDAQVPGVGEVDMTSPYSIGALVVGTAGLLGVTSVAAWAVNKAKSTTGAADIDNPLSGTLGEF
jgi:hypothetical protein